MGICLFEKTLLSNGCCIFAYLAVVAQQRVHEQQYSYYEVGSLMDKLNRNAYIRLRRASGLYPVGTKLFMW
jgi:hypothetical protein